MPVWKIDTLDARGGLAFASWRDTGLDGDDAVNCEQPCIFIGPPDFRPEPVANRAIALAAGRGVFQTGLFIEGEEVSFPTLDTVVEFVRRTYLRSGGGDGADGGGGETPAPRPADRPDLPRSPDLAPLNTDGEGLRPAILKATEGFQDEVSRLTLGEVSALDYWQAVGSLAGGMGNAVDGPHMLASAALRLIYAMIQRLPSCKDASGIARWQRDARRLGDLLMRLDLWPFLLSQPYYKSLEMLAENLLKLDLGFAALDAINRTAPPRRGVLVIFILFIDGPALDELDGAVWFIRSYYYSDHLVGHGLLLGKSQGLIDPITDLSCIPLPEDFEQFIGAGLKNGPSLYHALTAFIGSPITALGHNEALIDLILFASACVVGPVGGRPLSVMGDLWQVWGGPRNVSRVQRAALEMLAHNSWEWLAQHLPRVAFAKPLEEAIESVATVRYSEHEVFV